METSLLSGKRSDSLRRQNSRYSQNSPKANMQPLSIQGRSSQDSD